MKHTRKIAGIFLLALAMLISMAGTAFAANITINGVEGAEYAAYKLLNATNQGTNYSYTFNDKYADILKAATGKDSLEEIEAYILSLDADDKATDLRDLADAIYAAITTADPAIEPDVTTDTSVFEDVAEGYYLIAETKVANEADTFSLVMLNTVGKEDITVNTKEDKPTVEKKIEEVNDTTGTAVWGDSADHDIGDEINYRVTGSVSNKYAYYSSYYYSFVDTMEDGLTYNQNAKVYIVNGDSKVDVTEQFTIANTVKEGTDTVNGFTATANLKELTGVTITETTTVVVEYTATLNENALHGTPGNKNVVYLEYENNPYHEADGNPATPDKPGEPDQPGDEPGDEEPGKTEEDVNIVFTFKSVVNKTDKSGAALEGAGFTLYKWVKDGVAGEEDTTADGWVKIGDEITGVTTFTFEGLDAGKYKLEESTVPAGYNKCDDIEFEVAATYNTEVDPPALAGLVVKDSIGTVISEGEGASFTATLADGAVTTNVVNVSGEELPSTGGIGTTIFYILGSVLVIGAVVLLVAKKRMNNSDN